MRILLVRVGAMGDVLHALPAVAGLRAMLPDAHLAWAIEPRWQALLRDTSGHTPLVDTLHLVETRLWKQRPLSLATARSLVSLRSGLRAGAYDFCIDLQGSLRSATIGWLAHARELVGSAHPRETPARLLYHRRVPLAAMHVVDQAANLLSAAVHLPLTPASVPLPADPTAEVWWRDFPNAAKPFVFLVPQAGWGAKQWPADRMGKVARQVSLAGFRVLVNQAHHDDPLAAAVVQSSRGTASAIATDLPQLIALIRRASLVIAGDTGPLHLAAALGRPVLALFGPTDPVRTGPYNTPARVLRHVSSVTDHTRHQATEGGLLQITTEAVLEAARDLLHGNPAEPHL